MRLVVPDHGGRAAAERHPVADPQLRQLVLRQLREQLDGPGDLDRVERLAGEGEVAGLGEPGGHHARVGSGRRGVGAHHLGGLQRLLGADPRRLGAGELGLGDVERLRRDRPAVQQRLVAREDRLLLAVVLVGGGQARLRRLHGVLEGAGIDERHDLALRHPVALAPAHLEDRPGDLRGHGRRRLRLNERHGLDAVARLSVAHCSPCAPGWAGWAVAGGGRAAASCAPPPGRGAPRR